MLLSEAKDALNRRFNAGEVSNCPCCGQVVKRYNRKITGVMAAQLIQLDRAYPRPVHYKALRNHRGGDADYSKLRYWGLGVEAAPGLWQITDDGRRFVRGLLTVQRVAHVFNNTVVGFAGPQVSIRQCLGARFDYDELMSAEVAA